MPVGCLLEMVMQMYEETLRRHCLCDDCIKWKAEHPEEQEEEE